VKSSERVNFEDGTNVVTICYIYEFSCSDLIGESHKVRRFFLLFETTTAHVSKS
jgi:hypothetical protein